MTDSERIASAIRFVQNNAHDQPSLQAVADHLGLSTSHTQRLFTRWAGVSPKRFLQHITHRRARGILERGRTVLQAAYESGLSGPGRLHDLFVSVESVTPGDISRQGDGLTIATGIHDTIMGRTFIATTQRGVCALQFVGRQGVDPVRELRETWPEADIVDQPKATAYVAEALNTWLSGKTPKSVSLFLRGSNFQLQVWRALLKIPEGQMATYREVALEIQKPAAAGAISRAARSNMIAVLIPCHRLIRANGAAGIGYKWGQEKESMLTALEACRLSECG